MTPQEQIREIAGWQARHRQEYEAARDLLRDPERWASEREAVLGRLREILTGGPSASPHFTLGRCREALLRLEGPEDVVARFERKTDEIRRLERQIASEGERNPAKDPLEAETLL